MKVPTNEKWKNEWNEKDPTLIHGLLWIINNLQLKSKAFQPREGWYILISALLITNSLIHVFVDWIVGSLFKCLKKKKEETGKKGLGEVAVKRKLSSWQQEQGSKKNMVKLPFRLF